MPRTRELTWQPGSANRSGRWRKKYKSRSIYLCSARCKSDLEGYQRALEIWRVKKLEIDAEEAARPKPHQKQYEDVIREWEQVLRWSVEHADEAHAALARDKLSDLRARLELKTPPCVTADDRLWSRFTWPQEALETIGALAEGAAPPVSEDDPSADSSAVIRPNEKTTEWLDGSPQRIQQEVWQDRLQSQAGKEGQAEDVPDTIESLVTRYLAEDQSRVRAGKLSAGRYTSKRVALEYFRDWMGGTAAAESIRGKTLLEYRGYLLEKVASAELATDTAHDRLNDVKSFVRWLWQVEALTELPRIMADKSRKLSIGKKLSSPQVYSLAEVKRLLKDAPERTKLYLLLMLNTASYQSDISDLRHDQVDWREGRITRKRSKTQHHDRVPVVGYKLWPETFALLKKHRAKDGARALLNSNGKPLVVHALTDDGKPRNSDAIKSAFHRLSTKTEIKKPLKLFRKTSASLIANHERYRSLEQLFLGHAPASISDRNYTQAPQKLLDEAVEWLGKEYGIIPTPKANRSKKTSATKKKQTAV